MAEKQTSITESTKTTAPKETNLQGGMGETTATEKAIRVIYHMDNHTFGKWITSADKFPSVKIARKTVTDFFFKKKRAKTASKNQRKNARSN